MNDWIRAWKLTATSRKSWLWSLLILFLFGLATRHALAQTDEGLSKIEQPRPSQQVDAAQFLAALPVEWVDQADQYLRDGRNPGWRTQRADLRCCSLCHA